MFHKIKPHVGSAFVTSMIIGVILSIINHPQEILSLEIAFVDLYGLIPNFVVPFSVSLFSRVSAAKNCNDQVEPIQ